MKRLPVATFAAALTFAVAACGDDRATLELEGGGDSRRGPDAIEAYGCGSCHTIPGVRTADGLVGPPLTDFGRRVYIAGQLTNNPENLIRWIMDPQEVEPGTAMPDLEVTEEDARDIAAYLETLGR